MAKAGSCSATSSPARSVTSAARGRSPLPKISARAQPHAGAQEFLRVDRFAVDPGFVVQMRAGRPAGRAHSADHLTDLDLIANPDADLRQMAVAGRQAVAMVDFHHAAVAAGPSR